MIKYGMNSAINFRLNNFATGNYNCKCKKCGEEFIGDKRAVWCLQCDLDNIESLLHERVVKPTLAEMDKMWINYVDNTLQIEFEELMKKHNKCVKGRKGVPREVRDYLASYYNDLIEINNSKCSL